MLLCVRILQAFPQQLQLQFPPDKRATMHRCPPRSAGLHGILARH
jgi:hypothetical protein